MRVWFISSVVGTALLFLLPIYALLKVGSDDDDYYNRDFVYLEDYGKKELK